ncbi:putative pfs domain protein [Neofusicoccum parvum UCRNP2]|uniref:Putative pfs domain protein n=1 Tax=Botryosphaeria parva (strain UCR-NP2) TaxID=1287680 RepID=R1EC65_BOTPV|nr:putative pfs domain protein [Neofusicoccum parvum UCRNP2]
MTSASAQIELIDLYSDEGRIFNLQDDTWYAVDVARTSVNIQVEWNRSDYIDSLGPSARKLREWIQVSGTEGKAYASTIEDYVKMCWPRLAHFLDPFIDFLLDSAPTSDPIDVQPGLTLTMARQDDSIEIRATGDTTDLVQLIQQLAWLATALRRNPDAGRLLAASVTIQTTGSALSIRAEPLRPLEEGGGGDDDVPGSCWLPMFRGRVLARGFPVPERRGGEPGVELCCDVLDLLPGPPWFDLRRCKGGVALVSETAAIIPYRKDGEAGSIRWYYMEASRKELTMEEVERRYAGEVQKTEIWDLWPRREFVG